MQKTEIVVRVESGSSNYIADLTPILNGLLGQMSSVQTLAAILETGFIFGGVLAFKHYLNYRSGLHKMDYELKISAEEKKLLESVMTLKNNSELMERVASGQGELISAFMKILRPKDQLSVDKTLLVNGETAKRLR